MLRIRTTLAALAIGITLALAPVAASVYAHAQEAAQPRPVTVQEIAPVYTPVQPIAQPVIVPIQNPDGTWDLTPLIDGFVKFAGGCLALAGTWLIGQATWPFKKWLGLDVDAKKVAADINMDKYAKLAVEECIRYAKQQTGLTDEDLKNVEIRNPFLRIAASYLFDTDNDVWMWVSKTEAGVTRYIEANLDPNAALPKNVVDGVGIVPTGTAGAAPAQ